MGWWGHGGREWWGQAGRGGGVRGRMVGVGVVGVQGVVGVGLGVVVFLDAIR